MKVKIGSQIGLNGRKNVKKISLPNRPKKMWQATQIFSHAQGLQIKKQKFSSNSKVSVTKKPPMRNRHLNKLQNVANIKQSADFQCDSIPLHNRFKVFNSVKHFPESVLTVQNCEQKTTCLHFDDKCKLDNCDVTSKKACGRDNTMETVKSIGNDYTETVVDNVYQIAKKFDRNMEGESNNSNKNTSASPLQHRSTFPPGLEDKYDLDLRFRPRHQKKIASAKHCVTLQNWNDQNCEKFGFIPLGEILLPPVDLNNISKEKIFDVHRRIKASGTHNFLQSQILIQSQLKPELWECHLTGYSDSQLSRNPLYIDTPYHRQYHKSSQKIG